MKKQRSVYICKECGHESIRWLGKCPQCEAWNSFVEEVKEQGRKEAVRGSAAAKPVKLKDVEYEKVIRLMSGISELDRVLGNGMMPGSIILLGGDPGIGKSTLVLQASCALPMKTLYVSGEESVQQIKLRAERLKLKSDDLLLLSETELNSILSIIESEEPSLVIIDSIQTTYDNRLENSAGSVTQLRECTSRLMEATKRLGLVTILIGHITKEGTLAGPKILEHIVDTVLLFEGDSTHSYRVLRAQKNRFGNANEIGVFEMSDRGLREITNPSEFFISERKQNIPGSIITASVEGTRPILIEVQALVTPTHFGNPQRVTNGFDYRRLSILLAVLEKRNGLRLSATNVFLNITGGIRIDEPAIDLPVCLAVASSLLDKPIDPMMLAMGEVGLGGEIRSISNIEKRIQEAEKIGFTRAILPARGVKSVPKSTRMKIVGVDSLIESLQFSIG